VVITVVGILAALVFQALSKSKLSARATGCLGNLHQVGLALQLYADEYEYRYPVMFDVPLGTEPAMRTNLVPTVDSVMVPYLATTNVLRCPADSRGLFERTRSSYAWNTLLNGQDTTRPTLFASQFNVSQIPVFFDRDAFHRDKGEGRGVNYLYADGHTENQLTLEPLK